jgi:8-oxo-dGTP pyrophosphatase MutT (NUDIX family)
MIHDVFQKGLVRGAERMPFDPAKRYFYVEHPTEGWRVFLRACCFIHERGNPDPMRFVVVKRAGKAATGREWEPPKGQMEGKDGLRNPGDSMMKILGENLRREVLEESRIKKIQELTHTGIILEDRERDYPPNTYFQYHIFSGYAHPTQIANAFNYFDWVKENPEEFKRQRSDQKEKDAIEWYKGDETKMMGRWSPTILKLYRQQFEN